MRCRQAHVFRVDARRVVRTLRGSVGSLVENVVNYFDVAVGHGTVTGVRRAHTCRGQARAHREATRRSKPIHRRIVPGDHRMFPVKCQRSSHHFEHGSLGFHAPQAFAATEPLRPAPHFVLVEPAMAAARDQQFQRCQCSGRPWSE